MEVNEDKSIIVKSLPRRAIQISKSEKFRILCGDSHLIKLKKYKSQVNKLSGIPKDYDWQSLLLKDGDALEIHYRNVLETLGGKKVCLE